ncbi:hypothetical protein DPMN_122660 [Dreissena polymorpha]|uniref:Uncharacterized protein n=1 Tax=Dreissena polymorpha TaxID=45954 RepID=A0A9D4JQS1_DREPO|nr:hypothetical protein DPMN_122660 [Dreissena polymorpha]
MTTGRINKIATTTRWLSRVCRGTCGCLGFASAQADRPRPQDTRLGRVCPPCHCSAAAALVCPLGRRSIDRVHGTPLVARDATTTACGESGRCEGRVRSATGTHGLPADL